ncbi:MAG: hypothetical protein PHY62_10320 [Gallionella sp.]|nr:hypothetical protein [Gallionella sp.]
MNTFKFVVLHGVTSIFFSIILLAVPRSAVADDSDLYATEEGTRLMQVRKHMRFSGEAPSFDGFSPAKRIKLPAPDGATYYTDAYKNKNNCVTFFSKPDRGEKEFALKWSGGSCNGKPIKGIGELQILYKVEINGKVYTNIQTYLGNFENGLLTGEDGKRVNFSFDSEGRVQEIYELSGEFAFGLLNGEGRKTWTGPKDAHPSAWMQEGNFTDSTAYGLIEFTRANPFVGIEADWSELVLNENGDTYKYQSHQNGNESVSGVMFFEGDPIPWHTAMETVSGTKESTSPENGSFIRVSDKDEIGQRIILGADCESWELRSGQWFCPKGSIQKQDIRMGRDPKTIFEGAFALPIPFDERVGPIKIRAGD